MKLLLIVLLILSACSNKSDSELLLDILTNKYANLEVNKDKKLTEIKKIKALLSSNRFNENTALKISSHLHSMGDHHLKLRKIEPTIETTKCVSSKIFSDSTYLIKIHSLWCESSDITPFKRFSTEFTLHAEKAKQYSNLIIDLQDNGGGGDKETRYLLARLISKKSYLYSYQYLNANLPFYKRSSGRWDKRVTEYIEPLKSSKSYLGDKKILVLINKNTFSSAEVVASVLKNSNNIPLVGQTTKGGAGDPKTVSLLNGKYELVYSTCLVWQEDGSFYDEVGVTPSFSTITQAQKDNRWP